MRNVRLAEEEIILHAASSLYLLEGDVDAVGCLQMEYIPGFLVLKVRLDHGKSDMSNNKQYLRRLSAIYILDYDTSTECSYYSVVRNFIRGWELVKQDPSATASCYR